ncbi:MAG: prepilin-type N-terminal cleavage/methylation domain-containing protein, partial [Actinobacteria bacterium]|nr:prepilin-type N-terminal cleavage/methylation domain-containing protein [Actinomycetota bacterium]
MFEAFHIRFTISLKTDARAGHSLIELLVVLAIVALVAVLPATTLGDVLARHDARFAMEET